MYINIYFTIKSALSALAKFKIGHTKEVWKNISADAAMAMATLQPTFLRTEPSVQHALHAAEFPTNADSSLESGVGTPS